MKVKVLKNILDANLQTAQQNQRLLESHGILAINIMASPGAGKTSLILKTIEGLGKEVKVGVIEGDIASTVDADRISQAGVPVIQINTGGGCHLDANMVANALENMDLDEMDLLFIENVGNLVCPAGFKLGEQKRVVLASIPEGDDKPHKYPGMFSQTEAIVINKTDLLPYLEFDLEGFKDTVNSLNHGVRLFEVSAKTGHGFDAWLAWLKEEIKHLRK
jgi:hydrogenase nickel incorporation protein HypB